MIAFFYAYSAQTTFGRIYFGRPNKMKLLIGISIGRV